MRTLSSNQPLRKTLVLRFTLSWIKLNQEVELQSSTVSINQTSFYKIGSKHIKVQKVRIEWSCWLMSVTKAYLNKDKLLKVQPWITKFILPLLEYQPVSNQKHANTSKISRDSTIFVQSIKKISKSMCLKPLILGSSPQLMTFKFSLNPTILLSLKYMEHLILIKLSIIRQKL